VDWVRSFIFAIAAAVEVPGCSLQVSITRLSQQGGGLGGEVVETVEVWTGDRRGCD
jgi:hypothetical protein